MTDPRHEELTPAIRAVIAAHGRLGPAAASLGETASLYDAGMTSHASVDLMLALEAAFELEFPDRMLRREVFESIASIREAVLELRGE